MNLLYREYGVSPFLKGVVYGCWSMTSEGNSREQSPIQHCFPAGFIELIIQVRGERMMGYDSAKAFRYPESIFTGIFERAALWSIPGDSELFGIRLYPEAAMKLFPVPLTGFRNTCLDTDCAESPFIRHLIRQIREAETVSRRLFITENLFHEYLTNRRPAEEPLGAALDLLRSESRISIKEISDRLSIGERQLQRIFRSQLGIGPKNYSRLIRLYRAHNLGLLNRGTLGVLALDLGYTDSAHFCRDFKEYFGLTPSEYFSNTPMKKVL